MNTRRRSRNPQADAESGGAAGERRIWPATHEPSHGQDVFRRFAHEVSKLAGTAWAFLVALAVIIGWAILGPAFGFSDTWQLVINTGTTIVTFLMVFLIQNTQNRDARAMQLKLDELLHALRGARDQLIDLEELGDEELDRLQREFERIRKRSGR